MKEISIAQSILNFPLVESEISVLTRQLIDKRKTNIHLKGQPVH